MARQPRPRRHRRHRPDPEVACHIGRDLASVGITFDYAPDADVNSDPNNPVIGSRAFGAEPDRVARHTAAWVTGLQDAGVAACAKHFPGHGNTSVDSHLDVPIIKAGRPSSTRPSWCRSAPPSPPACRPS